MGVSASGFFDEYPVWLNDFQCVRPDFRVLNIRTRRVYLWEHLGMMDDTLYRAEVKIKLEEYENAGIVPWDNLILTYDAIGGGLQARQIEAAIQGWLM